MFNWKQEELGSSILKSIWTVTDSSCSQRPLLWGQAGELQKTEQERKMEQSVIKFSLGNLDKDIN